MPQNSADSSGAKKKANATIEEIKLAGNQLVDRVRDLIEEGNVRHVKIKKDGKVLLELPLTVGVGAGAAAVLLTPVLAAVGALAALVTDITLVVERDETGSGNTGSSNTGSSNTGSGSATGEPTKTPASKPETDKEGAGDTPDKTIGK